MSQQLFNALWIGNSLSKLELLTIYSFINNGHTFRLWIYDKEVAKQLPPQVLIGDANEIIPVNKVFNYKQTNTFGHGKGSYAGFSDIFRYKMLYLHGGWWVDMDITCVKPIDFTSEYFFRAHHELILVGNVIKCPKGSEVMLKCFEEATQSVNENNTDWHKPIEILCRNVQQFGLEKYVVSNLSNHDKWDETVQFIKTRKVIPMQYYFLHWQNEEWRHRPLDKNNVRIQSTLGELMQLNGLLAKQYTQWQLALNRFQQTWFYQNLKLLGLVDN